MSAAGGQTRGRPIEETEPTGVLAPQNLQRFAAGWVDPTPAIADLVDQFWHVRWSLAADEVIDQRIIDLPAVTLTIETGETPAPLLVTGVQTQAWRRRIRGTGDVFGIRLRPAGLAVVSDLEAAGLVDQARPVTPELDARLHRVMSGIARARDPLARAESAEQLMLAALADRPAADAGLLVNAAVDLLRQPYRSRTVAELAAELGFTERTLQRACRLSVGKGPKWLIQRVRLQQAALLLLTDDRDVADLAAELGYADQAHLTADFRRVSGWTPGRYRRVVRSLG